MSRKRDGGEAARPTRTKNIIRDDIVMNPEFPDVITVRRVEVLDGFCVRMKFSNSETRELDLEPYLRGPVFEAIRRDQSIFRQVFVDRETETLTWPTGADIDPETLYQDSASVKVNRRHKAVAPSPAKPVKPIRTKTGKTLPKSTARPFVRLQAKRKQKQ